MARASRTLVVKIGSSTLIDKKGRLDRQYLHNLARQLEELRDMGWAPIVVSSGAIAVGLNELGIKERPHDVPSLQAAASVGQGVLSTAYAEIFEEYGMLTSVVLLTRHDTASRHAYLHARDALNRLLDFGVVPIVNENDTTSVEEIKFGDNDTLSAIVACLVKADHSVIFSDVKGLYDANPNDNPQAKLISRVDRVTEDIMGVAGGVGSKVGSGGMVTKIRAARVLMVAGIPLTVCEGHEPDALVRIAKGEPVGTLFSASFKPHEITGYKLWIALGDSAKGSIVVDDGAKMALKERGKSLLCVGVSSVQGFFEAGDIVDIRDLSGHLFARGKVNASADEIDLARGYSTQQMRRNRLLAGMADKPIIHRDELVVFD
ncbi:MAG: glutamate 5-kinase [Coriobacteriaceae bacterium]|nr:glutamate 5-kinase [Coriobacteriaceae bacterium]MDY3799639.1 glutamate 5-kinase [Eggerthellaceae bacterium]